MQCIMITEARNGGRNIDTARLYGNEEQIGRAIRGGGVDRDALFLTTKYAQRAPGGETEALTESLRRLGVDGVDLWLMLFLKDAADNLRVWEGSSPPPRGALPRSGPAITASSNWMRSPPRGADHRRSISFGSIRRCTTGTGGRTPPSRSDPVCAQSTAPPLSPIRPSPPSRIGAATPAQVVLAWHLAHDIPVIPKSVHPDRISENYHALELTLSAADVAEIDTLGRRR